MSSRDSRRRNDILHQRRAVSPLLVMLFVHIVEKLEHLPVQPPVTIALIIMNVLPHLYDLSIFNYSLSNAKQNCVNPNIIIRSLYSERKMPQWNRIIFSGFMHVDDYHLYCNMMSLVWKGINLEKELGSVEFSAIVIFSLFASHTLMVVLSYLLLCLSFDSYLSGYDSCSIGFSAVLFSLKYIWNYMSPEVTNVMGLSVPSKYAAWLELVLISLVSPNVSFMGHLCGIFAGYLYVHIFKRVFRKIFFKVNEFSRGPRYTYSSGYSGTKQEFSNSQSIKNRTHDIRNNRLNRIDPID